MQQIMAVVVCNRNKVKNTCDTTLVLPNWEDGKIAKNIPGLKALAYIFNIAKAQYTEDTTR
ncbi:hypothetical protein ANCDUO_19080 [Ancylostoma duodenale]|uniref:Uncharacterized protein n=1 Tax=Ancylostoma duodenale TaxID=51022 RepID=A0A0C2C3H8_9BILA|nr:hypothetical protein ANCDUO_19080 [Ancylostoma duodenale]